MTSYYLICEKNLLGMYSIVKKDDEDLGTMYDIYNKGNINHNPITIISSPENVKHVFFYGLSEARAYFKEHPLQEDEQIIYVHDKNHFISVLANTLILNELSALQELLNVADRTTPIGYNVTLDIPDADVVKVNNITRAVGRICAPEFLGEPSGKSNTDKVFELDTIEYVNSRKAGQLRPSAKVEFPPHFYVCTNRKVLFYKLKEAIEKYYHEYRVTHVESMTGNVLMTEPCSGNSHIIVINNRFVRPSYGDFYIPCYPVFLSDEKITFEQVKEIVEGALKVKAYEDLEGINRKNKVLDKIQKYKPRRTRVRKAVIIVELNFFGMHEVSVVNSSDGCDITLSTAGTNVYKGTISPEEKVQVTCFCNGSNDYLTRYLKNSVKTGNITTDDLVIYVHDGKHLNNSDLMKSIRDNDLSGINQCVGNVIIDTGVPFNCVQIKVSVDTDINDIDYVPVNVLGKYVFDAITTVCNSAGIQTLDVVIKDDGSWSHCNSRSIEVGAIPNC